MTVPAPLFTMPSTTARPQIPFTEFWEKLINETDELAHQPSTVFRLDSIRIVQSTATHCHVEIGQYTERGLIITPHMIEYLGNHGYTGANLIKFLGFTIEASSYILYAMLNEEPTIFPVHDNTIHGAVRNSGKQPRTRKT